MEWVLKGPSWGLGKAQLWVKETEENPVGNRHSSLGMLAMVWGDTLMADDVGKVCPCFLEDAEKEGELSGPWPFGSLRNDSAPAGGGVKGQRHGVRER